MPERLRPFAWAAGPDLRDHVARALDDDRVALADVLAVDVLLVVERRLGDGDAADLDRLGAAPRVERARAPDADVDLEELRLRRHRRPLEGAGPAQPAVERAEALLLVERVDLDDDPVDLVVELDALALPFGALARDVLERFVALRVRVGAKAALASHSRIAHCESSEAPSGARCRRPRSTGRARP